MKKNFVKKYLTDEKLDKISKFIGEIEMKTAGEIRVSLKKKKGFFQNHLTSKEIGLMEFHQFDMQNTIDKTGVLILIIFDDHEFEIIADEGINSKISHHQWTEFTNEVKHYFSERKYFEGIIFVLNGVGEILIKEFPIKPGDKNELSNEVIVR